MVSLFYQKKREVELSGSTRQAFSRTHNTNTQGVFGMTEKQVETIEKLAEDVEISLTTDYEKKDLKERRSMTKNCLYDGSKKLKHSIPKGKRI